VDNELEDLAPYEALPLLFKQDIMTLLKATDATTFAKYLQPKLMRSRQQPAPMEA